MKLILLWSTITNQYSISLLFIILSSISTLTHSLFQSMVYTRKTNVLKIIKAAQVEVITKRKKIEITNRYAPKHGKTCLEMKYLSFQRSSIRTNLPIRLLQFQLLF